MDECNCNCCCAYLNPPWWVTMGYAPPAGFRPQSLSPSQSTSAPSDTQGSRVMTPPPASGQGTSANATGMRPSETAAGAAPTATTVANFARDLATGDIASTFRDLVQLL